MKKLFFLAAVMACSLTPSVAGEKLDLKQITRGEFRSESMQAVCPMADGESYSQICNDGKRIVNFSFRTGKQLSVLFDVETARGEKISRVEGYIMGPDGRYMLIQTTN